MMMRRPTAPEAWPGDVDRLAHLRARDYIRYGYLPQDLWDAFFTFSTVRNPFKRFESLFHYSGTDKNFETYIRWAAGVDGPQ